MKVFFRAPLKGKDAHNDYYKKIYEAIEQLGYSLTDKFLLMPSVKEHYKKLEEGGDKMYTEVFENEVEGVKNSDINLFECSVPSLGLGFLIERSLSLNKPTVVIYLEHNIPHLLVGIKDDRIIIRKVTEKNIKSVLKEALDEARTRADKRFNFFISPKLLDYLERISKEEGITKSKFIRNLILDHMRKSP